MGEGYGGGGRAPSVGAVARELFGGNAITSRGTLRNPTAARRRTLNRRLRAQGSTASVGADGFINR